MKKPDRMEMFSQDGGHVQGEKRTYGNPKLMLLAKEKMTFLLS